MKNIILFFATVFILSTNAKAQEQANRKYLQVHTIYLNITAENMNVNVDSLLQLYKKMLFDKNPFYLNTKIVRHWYGHDSREVLVMSELKSWDDIAKADAKRDELISQAQHMPNMEAAGKMWFSIISPEHHSDEIYYVVTE
ncbi:MAG TPA: hypothetical protein VKR53_21285 [Puia sp.]|nr:hypothetical protein [Puia sp.]